MKDSIKEQNKIFVRYEREMKARADAAQMDGVMDDLEFSYNLSALLRIINDWILIAEKRKKPTEALLNCMSLVMKMNGYNETLLSRLKRYRAEYLDQKRTIQSLAKDNKDLEKQVKILREEVKFLEKT